MSDSPERRQAPRHSVHVVAMHRHAGESPAVDPVTDLSQNGLFLRTQRRSTLGESFEVEFTAQDLEGQEKKVVALCEVARVTPDGVGAYFTHLDPDSALLLNLMLSV